MISKEEYIKYAENGFNIIPLVKTIDQDLKEKFGNFIEIKDLDRLPIMCEKLINDNNLSKEKIDEFSKKYFSNLNKSADYAVDYLIKKSNISK